MMSGTPVSEEWHFFLGKFVYLMDAYEDLEKDKKSGNYNPFVFVEQNEEYEEKCRSILSMMMAECSKEFEKLPIIHNIELLRNILYSGVWCRYEQLRMKKERLQMNDPYKVLGIEREQQRKKSRRLIEV